MKEKNNKHRFLTMPIFSLVLIFLEVVFRLSTGGKLLSLGFLYTALFSIAYGMVCYLLTSLFRNKKVNMWIGFGLMLATCFIYVVQFLIYKQFKQFYDINTMTGGAGDALTSYFRELLALLFQQGGIFNSLLMLAPAIAYPFVASRWLPAVRGNGFTRILAVELAVLCFFAASALISAHSIFKPIYYEQYNFQSAVSNFGLLTGLRLDIQNELSGDDYNFEIPEETSVPTTQAPDTTAPDGTEPEETTVPVTTAPVVIEYNEVDIDFAALNDKGSSQQKALNAYVSSLTATQKNQYTGLFEGKNLIFLTAEAFSAELIDPELTPTLYRLATKGIQFTDYYQPASAGTTGGEYQNVFGLMPTDGGRSFKNTAKHLNYYTMGNQLNRLGYYGKAFHNNSYTYYDRNVTHNNLGYSDGFMGYGNGMEEYVTKNWPQSDYEMISGTLPTYIDKQPFNIYYMTVSGHSNYSKGGNGMTRKHWDRVQHLDYSDDIKGYFAANLDLEDGLAHLVSELEAAGIADDTVIVLSTDHFPYGLDSDAALGHMPLLSELYGYNVDNYFERDHSALIIWSGCLEDMEPIVVDTPTFSLDILPTLSNLFGTEFDSRLMVGRDVFSDAEPLVFNTNYDWKTDLGTYYASSGKFVPVSDDTVIPEGYVDRIKASIRNKMTYCEGVLDTDYFRYLFG